MKTVMVHQLLTLAKKINNAGKISNTHQDMLNAMYESFWTNGGKLNKENNKIYKKDKTSLDSFKKPPSKQQPTKKPYIDYENFDWGDENPNPNDNNNGFRFVDYNGAFGEAGAKIPDSWVNKPKFNFDYQPPSMDRFMFEDKVNPLNAENSFLEDPCPEIFYEEYEVLKEEILANRNENDDDDFPDEEYFDPDSTIQGIDPVTNHTVGSTYLGCFFPKLETSNYFRRKQLDCAGNVIDEATQGAWWMPKFDIAPKNRLMTAYHFPEASYTKDEAFDYCNSLGLGWCTKKEKYTYLRRISSNPKKYRTYTRKEKVLKNLLQASKCQDKNPKKTNPNKNQNPNNKTKNLKTTKRLNPKMLTTSPTSKPLKN